MVLFRKIKSGFKIIDEDLKYLFQDRPFTLREMDYEEYWKTKGPSGLKERFKILADHIEAGSSVLDIGCGDGTCLQYLRQKKKISGEGIDISLTAVKLAKGKGIAAWVEDVSRDKHFLQKQYDYIILLEFLEHLAQPEKILLAVRDKFKKNLIVTIPNIGFYPHRLRLLFGRFPIQWAFHPGEHLRFWTIKDFTWWANELRYEVKEVIPSSGFTALRLYKLFPSIFGNQIVFILSAKV